MEEVNEMVRSTQKLTVGMVVIFHDATGQGHCALVKAVHGACDGSDGPCINLVYISGDSALQDQHGRRAVNETSVVHGSRHNSDGSYWRFAFELTNEAMRDGS